MCAQGFGAVFDGKPLFKLRLTRLGRDGGCVLAATVSHAVCDGAHLMASLVDLASACRGELLQPLPGGLSRRLFTPEGLGEAVPFLKPMLDEVVAMSEAEVVKGRAQHLLALASLAAPITPVFCIHAFSIVPLTLTKGASSYGTDLRITIVVHSCIRHKLGIATFSAQCCTSHIVHPGFG